MEFIWIVLMLAYMFFVWAIFRAGCNCSDEDKRHAKQVLPKGTILKYGGVPVELMHDTEIYSNNVRRVDLDGEVTNE